MCFSASAAFFARMYEHQPACLSGRPQPHVCGTVRSGGLFREETGARRSLGAPRSSARSPGASGATSEVGFVGAGAEPFPPAAWSTATAGPGLGASFGFSYSRTATCFSSSSASRSSNVAIALLQLRTCFSCSASFSRSHLSELFTRSLSIFFSVTRPRRRPPAPLPSARARASRETSRVRSRSPARASRGPR